MWICITDGFMSATKRKPETVAEGDEWDMQVRARKAEHLSTLQQLILETCDDAPSVILKSTDTDYQYRMFCTQQQLAVGVAALVLQVDYTNFKNTVTDDKLHGVFSRIWSVVLNAFPDGSIYGWSEPTTRRGGKKAKRGDRRVGGLPVTEVDWNAYDRPWWSQGLSVEEELLMRTHDGYDPSNPFDHTSA